MLPNHPGIRPLLRFLAVGLIAALASLTVAVDSDAAGSSRAGWLTSGPWGADVDDLGVSSAAPTRLYATTFSHVYRSDNGGASWLTTNATSYFEPTVAASGQDPNVVYTSNRRQVQKSVDGGLTWTDVTPAVSGSITDVAVDPTNDQIVYVGTSSSGS